MQVAMHMHRGFTSKVPFLQVASRRQHAACRMQHTARRMQHNNLSIASMHRGSTFEIPRLRCSAGSAH